MDLVVGRPESAVVGAYPVNRPPDLPGVNVPPGFNAFRASPSAPMPLRTFPALATPAPMTGLNKETTGEIEVSPPPTLCPSHEAAMAVFSPRYQRICPSLLSMEMVFTECRGKTQTPLRARVSATYPGLFSVTSSVRLARSRWSHLGLSATGNGR